MLVCHVEERRERIDMSPAIRDVFCASAFDTLSFYFSPLPKIMSIGRGDTFNNQCLPVQCLYFLKKDGETEVPCYIHMYHVRVALPRPNASKPQQLVFYEKKWLCTFTLLLLKLVLLCVHVCFGYGINRRLYC